MASPQVEEAFSKTSRLLFGEGLSPISKFGGWLAENIQKFKPVHAGGKAIFVPCYGAYNFISKGKVAPIEDFDNIAGVRLRLGEKAGLASIMQEFRNKARFVVEYSEGQNSNVEECTTYKNLTNSYRAFGCYDDKYIAFNSWADFNEYTFGCHRTFYSKLLIRCSHSVNLSACFEMDSCNGCSNSMFCHNCENVNDSLFCFHANNLRYAVGNTVVGREKFLGLKKELCCLVLRELKAKGNLRMSIYRMKK